MLLYMLTIQTLNNKKTPTHISPLSLGKKEESRKKGGTYPLYDLSVSI